MKKTIVILSAVLLSVFASNAQDIIFLKTGEEIKATVTEVGVSEVKYKKFGFEGGPVYLQLKSNIVKIKYANGSEDIFSKQATETVSSATEEPETSVPEIVDVDHPARAIYAEAFGNSLIWSLTYDTRFGPRCDGIGGRIGVGYMSVGRRSSYLTVPIMANYLLGSKGSFFELGLGGIIYVSDNDFLYANESTVIGTMTMGYRYQAPGGGLIAKVGLTPIFGDDGYGNFYFWPFYGGFSFGYVFP